MAQAKTKVKALNFKVQGPIHTQFDSAQRVAFDLMSRIAHAEAGAKKGDEKYLLELYARCLKVVMGAPPEES